MSKKYLHGVIPASILWAFSLLAFGQATVTAPVSVTAIAPSSSTTSAALPGAAAASGAVGTAATGARSLNANSANGLKTSLSLDSVANAPMAPKAPTTEAKTTESAVDRPTDKSTDTAADKSAKESIQINQQQSNFQRFVQQATGQALPNYGQNLFQSGSRFAPVSASPAHNDYILGPGDEIFLQIWGAVNLEHNLTINRHGQVNLPKVGVLNLAGIRYGDLESVLRGKIDRIFTNYKLNATLGRLRSIQIYVVGQAQQPGTHTISSLSTLINAMFEIGGPNGNGSMRNIQLKRNGRVVGEIDLYQFIAHGDRSGDVPLQPGDVIVIPPAGPRVAILGAFQQPAIYELKGEGNIREVLSLGGGLSILTTPAKAQLERVNPKLDKSRKVQQIVLDKAGLESTLRDGDILTLFEIGPQFANAVTLTGNVAAPMRYPYKPDMRVSDLVVNNSILVPVNYWLRLNASGSLDQDSRPEVNLDYATIQRLDPITLRTQIIPFNLSKALLGDPRENLLLKPEDLLRIYGPNDPGSDTLNSVTLSGELVGGVKRFAWRPGFKVKDLIPDRDWFIERLRMKAGAAVTSYSTAELNLDYATIQRLNPNTLRTEVIAINLGKAIANDPAENLALEAGDVLRIYGPNDPGADTLNSVTLNGEIVGGAKRFAWRKGFTINDIIPNAEWLVEHYNYWQKPSGKELRNDINWDYAQITRRIPQTLETRILTFNLGQAVMGQNVGQNAGQNQAQNPILEPGDQIRLFTTSEVPTPVSKRMRLVTLAGEVAVPGVYQVLPDETLPQLLQRAGGVSPHAYLYGTEFTRESVRQQQQKNLDTIIRKLEAQLEADANKQVANVQGDNAEKAQAVATLQKQQQLERMRNLKSNGRVSLELPKGKTTLAAFPELMLDDGDSIKIPTTPGYVSAVGEVFNENAIIYRSGKTVGDVIKSAGLSEQAEMANAFVLRADGSVVAARNHKRMFLFSGFNDLELMPGDAVVIPARLDRESGWTKFVVGLKDWTQIIYQLGLGAAAWNTLN